MYTYYPRKGKRCLDSHTQNWNQTAKVSSNQHKAGTVCQVFETDTDSALVFGFGFNSSGIEDSLGHF